jgi:hypothetical protein
MTEWTAVTVDAGTARIGIDLPPGWWSVHPGDYSYEVDAIVAAATSRLPPENPVAPELTAELGRLARVSAAAGAVLLAGGAALDPTEQKIVTAGLTLLPHETYLLLDHSAQEAGPDAQLALTAGPALRHLWLGPTKTVLGNVLMLEADYVIVPPQPPSWVLVFQTPALPRRAELVEVFNRIAASVRITHQATSVAGAFG